MGAGSRDPLGASFGVRDPLDCIHDPATKVDGDVSQEHVLYFNQVLRHVCVCVPTCMYVCMD